MQAPEDQHTRRPRLHPLPVSTTPLFGRDDDLASIRHLLTVERVRLLSLTGPGGTGKTRLACAAAAEVAATDFDGTVYFADLSAVEDPAVVPASVAQAVGILDTGSDSLPLMLAEVLGERPTLLVLDNFEQVLDAAVVVSGLLQRCPELAVLVTTREPLHLHAERIFPVGPLPASPSIALFLDRGRACRPSLALGDDTLPAIAEICARLDGLPLAIELAAAQIRVLSPVAILDRLRARAPLPLGGPRDAPPRHRTLGAAVASSYELLTPLEQTVFRWCAVFAGGFTVAAAAAVCAPIPPSLDILCTLAQLVDKSLILVSDEPDGTPRFRWLETIRATALDRLAELGELAEVRQRHARYCLELAEQADSAAIERRMGDTFDLLEREYDNLRAAFHWSLEGGDLGLGLALAGALYRFWMLRGHLTEARQWLERALPRSQGLPAAVQARALNAAGVLAGLQDDNEAAETYFLRSLALWRAVGDNARLAAAVGNLGLVAQNRHDLARALECFEESEALYAAAHDQRGIAISIGCRARLARQCGEHTVAAALFSQSVAQFRVLGDDWYLANSLANLGYAALVLTDLDAAAESFREALDIRHALGDSPGVAECLEGCAAVAGAAGQPRRAARLYGAADTLRELTGAPVSTMDRAEHDELLGRIRTRLGQRSFGAEWAAGRGSELEQAIQLARLAIAAGDVAGTPPAGAVLTRREREVAAHVADGMTNRQIAQQLMVAERTVETHLEHIFDKLGARTRSEVAVWVTRLGIEATQLTSSELVPRSSGRLGTSR